MSRPSTPRTEIYKALVSELDARDVEYRFEHGGKHGRLIITVDGVERKFVFSMTPSDRFATKNAVGDLRRMLRMWTGTESTEETVQETIEMDERHNYDLIAPTLNQIGSDEVQAINARDFHKFLGVQTEFKNWIVRRVKEYGFLEDVDFRSFLTESSGGRPSKEYAITLDMAKELAMVERNEMGRAARRYFIECEKRLKSAMASDEREAIMLVADLEAKVVDVGLKVCRILDLMTLDNPDAVTIPVLRDQLWRMAKWEDDQFADRLDATVRAVLGGQKKVIANPDTWRKAGMLPTPHGEEHEFKSTYELLQSIIPEEQIHSKLVSWVTNQILMDWSREQGHPQRQTQKRTKGQKPVVLFPLLPTQTYLNEWDTRSVVLAKNKEFHRLDAVRESQVVFPFPKIEKNENNKEV